MNLQVQNTERLTLRGRSPQFGTLCVLIYVSVLVMMGMLDTKDVSLLRGQHLFVKIKLLFDSRR